MAKLLRLKDYLLLSFAVGSEILSETRSGFGVMPASLKARYGFIPAGWKYQSYLSQISKMLSTNEIKKKVDKKGTTYLVLTANGVKAFRRKFPVFNQNKKWDGKFMVVTYDIPEKNSSNRKVLRLKLEELGFGMMQKSVWISPYHFEEDMEEYIKYMGLKNSVFVLSARKLLLGDIRVFADGIWNIEKLNIKYNEVLNLAGRYYVSKKEISKSNLRILYKKYLRILMVDPLLPREFLPDDWVRERLLKELGKYAAK